MIPPRRGPRLGAADRLRRSRRRSRSRRGCRPDSGHEQVVLIVLTAIGNTTGLLLAYSSLRFGKVGVVAPITSAQGAAAAVIAVLAGEQIATGAGVALGRDRPRRRAVEHVRGRTRSAPIGARGWRSRWRSVAALFFGLGLFAMGRLSEDVPIAWIIFPSRTIAVLAGHGPARDRRAAADDARGRAARARVGPARGRGAGRLHARRARTGSRSRRSSARSSPRSRRWPRSCCSGERLARVQIVGRGGDRSWASRS